MKRKELTDKEKKEVAYGKQIVLANKKNDYIRNLINGRYFLARTNMLANELIIAEESGAMYIRELIDGSVKSKEYARAEYALQKMQAIMSMRNAHFAKQDLMKDHNLTDEDILDIEEDYYNGKIIREEYDEVYKKKGKAEFVEEQKE